MRTPLCHCALWALVAVLALPPVLRAQGRAPETLERIHALIQATNPELGAAQAAVAWFDMRARATGHAPAAQLSLDVEEVPGGLNLTRAGSARLDLSREFVPGRLLAGQRTQADLAAQRLRVMADATARRLRAQASAFIVEAIGAARIAARLTAEDSLLAAAEESIRSRFAVGDGRYVDVLRVRTERLRVQTEAAAIAADGRIARAQVIALVADTAAPAAARLLDALDADEAVAALARSDSVDPQSLVPGSASLQLAALAIAEAEAGVSVARAARRPSLVAAIGIQRFDGGGGFRVGPSLGLALQLPFTNRALRWTQLAADAELAAANRTWIAARQTMLAAARMALERYHAAVARVRAMDAMLVGGARDEREAALAAYRTGTLSLLELLDFERALARAETARWRGRMDAAAALAVLETELAAATLQPPAASAPNRSFTP